MKPALLDMTPEEVTAALQDMGQPAFRGKQVYAWLCRGADFADMGNVPKDLRAALTERYRTGLAAVAARRDSRRDDTCKYLFAFHDGERVEGVLMSYHHGRTLCISTQVGCRMGCAFCASTLGGRIRDLTAGEMLSQIIAVNADLHEQRGVSHVVMMGSGEPFDNYGNSVAFLRLINRPEGLNIGLRNISLSTCGLPDAMRRFAGEGLPVTLSISLHAPDDEVRRRIMPVARSYTVGDILDAARYYIGRTGRRVIIEYALIRDVNDEPRQARQLAGLLRGMQCHVNLIALNSVPETGLMGSGKDRIRAFMDTLKDCGVSVTRRREMGTDIEGACGQLRRRVGMEEKDHEREQ